MDILIRHYRRDNHDVRHTGRYYRYTNRCCIEIRAQHKELQEIGPNEIW